MLKIYSAFGYIKKNFLITFIAVITNSSLSLAQPGFMPVEDPRIPKAVKKASEAVYQIFNVEGEKYEWIDAKDYVTRYKNATYLKEQMQIQTCIFNYQTRCKVYLGIGRGSAFTMGSKNTLYTAMHNFFDEVNDEIENKKISRELPTSKIIEALKDTNLFFELQKDKKILYDSFTNTSTLDLIYPLSAVMQVDISSMSNSIGRLIDMIKLRLNIPMKASLKPAQTNLLPGEDVYLIGYPGETIGRSLVGEQDSDGETLRISKGHIISTEHFVKILDQKSSRPSSDLEKELFQNNFYFSDTDCFSGNSGGPLVNKSGEVVGLLISQFPDNDLSKIICVSINLVAEKKLIDTWHMIDELLNPPLK
jgi:hypothetical protein